MATRELAKFDGTQQYKYLTAAGWAVRHAVKVNGRIEVMLADGTKYSTDAKGRVFTDHKTSDYDLVLNPYYSLWNRFLRFLDRVFY